MTKVAEKTTLFPRFRRFFSSVDRHRSTLIGSFPSDQLKLTPADRDLQLRITLAKQ
jgi:hypothetical protein